MDDATLARLRRAAGWRHTGRNDLLAPRVVRRGDLQELLEEVARLQAIADGVAFDVDEEPAASPSPSPRLQSYLDAAADAERERLQRMSHDGPWR